MSAHACGAAQGGAVMHIYRVVQPSVLKTGAAYGAGLQGGGVCV